MFRRWIWARSTPASAKSHEPALPPRTYTLAYYITEGSQLLYPISKSDITDKTILSLGILTSNVEGCPTFRKTSSFRAEQPIMASPPTHLSEIPNQSESHYRVGIYGAAEALDDQYPALPQLSSPWHSAHFSDTITVLGRIARRRKQLPRVWASSKERYCCSTSGRLTLTSANRYTSPTAVFIIFRHQLQRSITHFLSNETWCNIRNI
jgi:hypothetical protein